jgi:signal transduction histidine kinase
MSVGVAVAAVSGSVILIGCVVLIVLSVTNAVQLPSEMEPNIDLERGRITFTPRPPRWGWLNADQFIWAVAILALVSLITTPIVAWVMARRAVKPMAEALRLQRHFVADASHELRTPLTALSSRVQILQRRLDSGKPIDDVARSLHADTTNMARVLDDMLLTVEGAPLVEGTRTSVVECLRQAITSLSPMAEQCDVTLTCQAASDMFVAAPETSLTRAVVAIVDNAIQHSPAGSRVDLSAETVDRTVIIRVRDQGPGIAGVDPSQVFDRFAHGSETGRKRSFGLGLALASEVAHRYGGDIRVESTSSEGTTFAASFPRV